MTAHLTSSTISGLLLVFLDFAPRPTVGVPTTQGIDACSLLAVSDASKALEQSSQPGKRMVESSPTGCIWSPDPKIKIERVAGLGDEAFYQIYPKDSPFIWVRKGTNAISIRIMGTKANRFSLEQEKAKELTLAKAAIAKL